jgi:uncharacterized membrane protein
MQPTPTGTEPAAAPRSDATFALAAGLPTAALLAALPFVQLGDGGGVPRPALFLGRFHPTILHLPVALLLLALFLECLRLPWLRRRFAAPSDASLDLVVWLAALTGFAAAVAGWLLSHEGGYDPDLLDRHLWAGSATGIGAVACAVLRSLAAARPERAGRRRAATTALAATCAVMIVASHAGAGLTHGEDYLTEHAPDAVRRALGLPVSRDRSREPVKPLEERAAFTDVVLPILENRCAACHGESRRKGDLRLDAVAEIRKGGKSGPAIRPGDVRESELLRRVRLPLEDKKHMPPKGKAQPAAEEVAILEWWVGAGAPDAAALGGLAVPAEVRAAIEGLMSGAERRALEERKRQEAARHEAALAELRKTLPGALRPILPGERRMEYTAAIAGKAFGDAELAKLAAVGRDLAWLDLSRTGVTDAGLKVLGAMPNLERLDLRGTAAGDEGLKALAGLSKLETLGLYGTGVTDAGLEPLRGLKNLKKLYLGGTKTTEEGAKKLREARPGVAVKR